MSYKSKLKQYWLILILIGMVGINLFWQACKYQNYFKPILISKITNTNNINTNPPLNDIRDKNVNSIVMENTELNINDGIMIKNNTEFLSIPGSNKNKTIFVMNTIYLEHENMIAIFLLGPRLWFTKDKKHIYYDNIKKFWRTWNKKIYQFWCLFEYNGTFYTNKMQFVPDVLFSEHKESTKILLCKIPTNIGINSTNQDYLQFIMYSKHRKNVINLSLMVLFAHISLGFIALI